MVRHSREVKAEALRLLPTYSVSAIARHLGIPRSTIAGWKSQAKKEGALESSEVDFEQQDLIEGVDSQVRRLLARLEREMTSIEIKSAKDLKDLSSAVGQLVSAREKLDLQRRTPMKENISSKVTYNKFLETLPTREVRVLNHILGIERRDDVTDEEVENLIEKMRQLAPFIPELARIVKATDEQIAEMKVRGGQ